MIDTDLIIDGLVKAIPAGYFTYKIVKSLMKDTEHGTTRNTFKTVVVSTAEAVGATVGYSAGSALEHAFQSRIEPKFTGLAFGLVGGALLGFGAGRLISNASERLFTALDYDTVRRWCLDCNVNFGNRLYEGEMKGLCPVCDAARSLRMQQRMLQLAKK